MLVKVGELIFEHHTNTVRFISFCFHLGENNKIFFFSPVFRYLAEKYISQINSLLDGNGMDQKSVGTSE